MENRTAGRPREFDRDEALRKAATMFWEHGFSGTSTRALSTALGVSSSSLYAAFGSKADLFDEAVRTYALRYSAIYDAALAEPTLGRVLSRLLHDSVREFARADDGHPGCLTTSAVMADTSATLDVRAFVIELQAQDERRLQQRIELAELAGEVMSIQPAALSALVQTLWHGLATRADLGASTDELASVVDATIGAIFSGTNTSVS